jgi:hypothetical protein
MKNKVNKKRGVKFLQGRTREGRGKSLHLLEATARPRRGQKRAGKKDGVLGEGIFARPPVLGGGWVCVHRRRTHKSEVAVRILFKVGSNFIQKIPPFYDFGVLRRYCLALASLGLGKNNDFIRIFEIKKQFSLQNLKVRFAKGEHKLKNLLTNLFCSAFGETQSGNLITTQKRL